jgi:hypothetical protein
MMIPSPDSLALFEMLRRLFAGGNFNGPADDDETFKSSRNVRLGVHRVMRCNGQFIKFDEAVVVMGKQGARSEAPIA